MTFCGAGSFQDVDKEEEDAGAGGKPAAAAKAKAKKAGGGKTKGKDNPYASRGLDKFSTVLSELESRRERILRRVGPDVDAVHLMVRFMQSEAKGWVPIVVKLPSEEEQADDTKKRQSKAAESTTTSRPTTPPTEPASPKEDAAKHEAPAVKAAVPAKKNKAAGGERWSRSWGRMVRPCHYWPLALVLLLCLVVFGRVFAICCASISWYLLPILTGAESQGATRLSPAKTRMSDKVAAVAPPPPPPPSHGKKSSSGAAHGVISPRSHAHRKKG